MQVKSRDSVQSVSAMLDDPDCSKEVRRWLDPWEVWQARSCACLPLHDAGWLLSFLHANLSTTLRPPSPPPVGLQASVEQRCSEAFAAVRHFEKTHCLALQNMGYTYLQRRSELVAKCFDVAAR